MKLSSIILSGATISTVLGATTSYSLYTTVVTFESTYYSTFTAVSCPPALSTAVVTSGDTVDTIYYLNTCNPDYTDYTRGLATLTITGTETDVVTSTAAAIPSSEIDWD